MLPPPPSRSRRRASPGLTNTVWHVVSRDFPLPNIYVRYAQPFGRGSCKEKKIRLRWQPTAAQPGSALTKIAGGHLGEPPTPRLVLLACLLFPAGAAAVPRRAPLLKPVGHQNPVKHRCPNKSLWPCVGGQATLTIVRNFSAKSSPILLVLT